MDALNAYVRASQSVTTGGPPVVGDGLLPVPLPAPARGACRPRPPSPAEVRWGRYAPAIARWERALGRAALAATDARGRLSTVFVEGMMGLAPGWVTNAPGLSRAAQLKALGNGVVPQQAAGAVRVLLERAHRARPSVRRGGTRARAVPPPPPYEPPSSAVRRSLLRRSTQLFAAGTTTVLMVTVTVAEMVADRAAVTSMFIALLPGAAVTP